MRQAGGLRAWNAGLMLHLGMNSLNPSESRIALFHPCFIHGGIQRVFLNLAKGFLDHGYQVDMVQATPGDGLRDSVPRGVRVVDLNASRAMTSIAPLVRYLRREKPAAMISAAVQTNIAALWARRLSGVRTRVVLTEHNSISTIARHARMFRTRITPGLVRRFYPWADAIVAVSYGTGADLAQIMGIAPQEIKIIYNPVISPELWARAAEPLNDPTFEADPRPAILAVGRLHYHKDYPNLLRAFAIVRQTIDARLLFLGDGEERQRLESIVREMHLESAVTFKGNVGNPLPYMKRAAVLALSSIAEALPTVLIEAQALGLPIVASDCSTGPREILCDGALGTLVPVGDSQKLAAALIAVLQSPARRDIPHESLERFAGDRVVRQYLDVVGLPPRT